MKQKRILIVRTDRVGDTVMITPIARELKKTFPDCFVATLTQPSTSAVLMNNPNIDKILTDNLEKETFWDVTLEIRNLKFTHGLLVFPTERAAYQMFFGRVKKRIMTGTRLYGIITFFHSVSRNNYTPLKHEADYCMDLARKIGVETDNIQPEIFVTGNEQRQSLELLKSKGVMDDDFKIFLHTGSKLSAPNWSEEKYYLLIKGMLEKFKNDKFKLLLTAYEMTPEFLAKINAFNDNRIINISKDLKSLRELISAISLADLMVCSSTGPVHLADALNVSCVGLHCHRNMSCAKHWGVLNKKSINLEVPADFCDGTCSTDKKDCHIEDGLRVEEVLKNIQIKR
jgi:heptosyltransferase-2